MPRKSEVTTANLVDTLTQMFGSEVDADHVRAASSELGVSYVTACKRLNSYKSGRGKWNLTAQEIERAYEAPSAQPAAEVNYIPEKDDSYVQFGNFQSIKKVIQSRQFYPIFVTGLSGNGKTFSVEQACAAAKRELIRVNITIETDEDDLIGGFRLVDGDTVWHNGPVIEALERGAVLLLDEIDLASNKILCLQSVLEGKGVFLKKIGRYVRPTEGFTVIATANTKGKGSDDGRFVGTNILNEAFLERFPVTFEQEYPTATVETKILQNVGADDQFAENLVKWAGVIRKTFFDGGVDEVITTRRLVHIVQAYQIFGDRLDAITKCVNRFDDDTKQSFLDLYTKVDAGEDSEYNENEDSI
ncbi:porphyrin biosynthesis [Cyanophage S-RIM50]|uniref:CobS n=10 Tax=Cyanophage S-RIM50 TaxID=687803 RepID=A0A127KLR2_9CAUD|nr:porphyrin biosynthesis [Cyanophage S-RIM50]AMO42930.1 CobS [Cyanophage S-RIM50]